MTITGERTCRGCGCTDRHACPGGCAWVLLDVAMPTGICSACANGFIKWDPQEMALIWEIDITPEAFAAGHRPLRGAAR